MTKNITLAVEEETLKKVRRIAVERDTTVNGLVRDYLKQVAGEEAAKAKRRKEMSRFLRGFRAKAKTKVGLVNWNREDLYRR
jgi:hypothetical protein